MSYLMIIKCPVAQTVAIPPMKFEFLFRIYYVLNVSNRIVIGSQCPLNLQSMLYSTISRLMGNGNSLHFQIMKSHNAQSAFALGAFMTFSQNSSIVFAAGMCVSVSHILKIYLTK